MVGKIQEVALAGLLHDIGKFSQRAGNEQRWKHEEFTEAFLQAFTDRLGEETAERITSIAASHHGQVTKREGLLVEVVDFLASAERQRVVQPQIPSERAALLALTSQVQLDKKPALSAFFSVRPFSLDEIIFFPNAFTACHCGECVACRLFGVASDYPTIRQRTGPAHLTVCNAFPAGYE